MKDEKQPIILISLPSFKQHSDYIWPFWYLPIWYSHYRDNTKSRLLQNLKQFPMNRIKHEIMLFKRNKKK